MNPCLFKILRNVGVCVDGCALQLKQGYYFYASEACQNIDFLSL